MIHVKIFNLALQQHLEEYERLLNAAQIHKTIQIVDIEKISTNAGGMNIYLVYRDIEQKRGDRVAVVNESELPSFGLEDAQELDNVLRSMAQEHDN